MTGEGMTDLGLKPCPFCGERDDIMGRSDHFRIVGETPGGRGRIICGTCGAQMPGVAVPGQSWFEDAAKHWNSRTP